MTRTITREDLLQRLEATPRPVLIEALPARHDRDEHLPGALHMPHDMPHDCVSTVAPQTMPDKAAEIVASCTSATCRRSHIAAAALERLGYRNVSVYPGDKEDRQAAGLALEPGHTGH